MAEHENMRPSLVSMLLLLLPGFAFAQKVSLPVEVKGEVGAFLKVAAVTDCVNLAWLALDSGLNLFPVDLLKDTKTAIVSSNKNGRYRLLAYGAKGDQVSQPAICIVVVGEDPGPLPPPPGPDPPPVPIDEFQKKLNAAWLLETETDKESYRKKLAAFYRQAAEITSRSDIANWGQLFDIMVDAANTLGIRGKLPSVQGTIQVELAATLPRDRNLSLDNTGRVLAKHTFTRVSLATDSIKRVSER